jgi:hypothetical protein
MAAEQVLGIESLFLGQPFNTSWVLEEKQGFETVPGRAKAAAEQFIPFAFRGNNFAFTAPLSKGMTRWKAQRMYEDAIEAYANPGIIAGLSDDVPNYTAKLDTLAEDVTEAAQLNGLDTKTIINSAAAVVRGRVYKRFLAAVEAGDLQLMEEYAQQVARLGAGVSNVTESAARRGIDLSRDDRRAIRETIRRGRREVRR